METKSNTLKNILFLIPPIFDIKELKTMDKRKYPIFVHKTIPIGLLSISSYLKSKISDININILDLNAEIVELMEKKELCNYATIDEILDKLFRQQFDRNNIDLLGISSLFSSTYPYLETISKYFKTRCSDTFIIAGGSVPTVMYEKVLNEIINIDAISLGEGEIPIYELLTTKNIEQYINSSNYWVNRKKLKNKNFKNDLKPYFMDLSQMPKIDYTFIDLNRYQNNKRASQNNSNITVSIMTSRGCPHKCCFCASHCVHGRNVRYIETKVVIEEMTELIDKYGVKTFLIEDDLFFLKKERALEILGAIKSKNISIEFPNGLAVYAMDRDIISLLKQCGTKSVSLAIESGSERILKDIIHKHLKLKSVKPIVDILREFDIEVHGLFIIGFPGETEQDRQATVDFVKYIGFDSVSINIATPLVGSELYDICKQKGYLISDKIENLYTAVGNIKTKEFEPEYIEECRTVMNLELNYVYNYDYINENYKRALEWYEYIIYRVPNHAFAYYFAAQCYKNINNQSEKVKQYINKYKEIINTIPSWKEYAIKFKLEIN